MSQAAKAAAFQALHRAPRPFLLPNVWDAGSARLLAPLGFAALGTTSAGVAFDNRASKPGARIAAIAAPTLIVHARDDTLQLYENAEFALATIPNATLLSFDRGGHLVIATEREAIGAAVRAHIIAGSGDAAPSVLAQPPRPDAGLAR